MLVAKNYASGVCSDDDDDDDDDIDCFYLALFSALEHSLRYMSDNILFGCCTLGTVVVVFVVVVLFCFF